MQRTIGGVPILHALVGALVLAGLYLTSLYSYLLFHTLAEMFSIVIAVGIFMLGWNTRHYVTNNYLLFLSIAYLFIALLDLLHTLSYKGMNIFTDYDYYANQLWIATRYLESLSLLAAFLFLGGRRRLSPHAALLGYALVTALIIASVFHWKIFPVCFVEGVGLTPFKKISEYVISSILLVDILLLYRFRAAFHPDVYRKLVWALAFTILSEIAFTFYISNYGFSNLVGHYFKIFSFWLIYKAILETGLSEPFDLIFKELKDTERALRISEQRLNLALEVVADGLWDWRRDTDETHFSDQLYIMLGYNPGEFAENMDALRALVHPDDVDRVERAVKNELLAGEPFSVEMRMRSREGAWLWVLSRGRAVELDENGRPVRFVGTHVDIAERKQLEQLKEDVERMMRHDLKTPLGGILGLPQLLEQEHNLTDDQRELLKQIEASGRRMQEMIDMSLDLFKMETGTYISCMGSIDVGNALRGLLAEHRPLQSAKGIHLRCLVDGEPLTAETSRFIFAEMRLLRNMLTNLLQNAVEASPEEQTVLIEYTHGRPATIEISNQGAVPPAARERFFEKYATAGKKRGTGLGTYSAKLMADVQGWDITMRTSEEHGTTVTITIPEGENSGCEQ